MNFYIVSSTHWDREWYEPFEKYRFRLVRMMDSLLEILETNPDYKYFHSDGQTIIFEDYLKIRPENAEKIAKFIKLGNIEIGPWYTMPEEWLASGESLIKNLQTGKKICDSYGVKCSPCGYICDLFGHNSQMPQIFSQFGLENVALFRGVEDTHKDLFRWIGADGTKVTVQKMHRDYAYSTFYFVVRYPFEKREYDKEEMVRRFQEFIDRETSEGNFATDNILLMDGVDHIDPEIRIPELIDWLKEAFPQHTFTHCNMKTYFDSVNKDLDKLENFTGCLYDVAKDGVNQALLKNCASSLVDQKQDNNYCETNLEKVLSPFNFHLSNIPVKANDKHFHSVMPYNGFFEEAWNMLIQNHAHDSICGCSVTATHLDTKNRFKRVREIVEVTKKNMFIEFTNSVNSEKENYEGSWLIYNHSQNDIDGLVKVVLPLKVDPSGHNLRIFDNNDNQLDYVILDSKVDFDKDSTYKTTIHFPLEEQLTVVLPLNIKANGYTTLYFNRIRLVKDENSWEYKQFPMPYQLGGTMRKGEMTFDTGKITVSVNSNGTLKVQNNSTKKVYDNLLYFEDSGDFGDGWNYIAPEFDTKYFSLCADADIAIEQDNCFVAVIKIINRLNIPVSADAIRRSNVKKDFFIESEITLLKGSSQISIKTSVNNHILNHRLRAVFPSGINSEKFYTKLPFDLYAWDVKKKDNTYAKEKDTYVNPNQGLVCITDQKDTFAVYNKGLYEVGVADDTDRTVALTLFRSFTNEVGSLKHDGLGTMQGTYEFEYALDFLDSFKSSQVVEKADSFMAGITGFEMGLHKGNIPNSGQSYSLTGNAIVSILKSNIKINDDVYNLIRIYDVDGGSKGEISFLKPIKEAFEIDLNGNVLSKINVNNGKIKYLLDNKKIKTIIFKF